MTVVDDLKAARAEVEKGWYQGGLTDGVRTCAVGAVNKACSEVHYYIPYVLLPRRDAVLDELRKHLPMGHKGGIISYNDAPTTTKQDILNLFDKTLADLGAL